MTSILKCLTMLPRFSVYQLTNLQQEYTFFYWFWFFFYWFWIWRCMMSTTYGQRYEMTGEAVLTRRHLLWFPAWSRLADRGQRGRRIKVMINKLASISSTHRHPCAIGNGLLLTTIHCRIVCRQPSAIPALAAGNFHLLFSC